MSERVVPVDLGVDWEPNGEDCYLIQDGGLATTTLVIDSNWARGDDRRPVVISWSGTSVEMMGGPNDERVDHHRLWTKGLSDVYRSGTVEDSELIAEHARHTASRLAGAIHYVLLLKGGVLEVVADSISVERFDGNLRQAALSVLGGHGKN
jgi:hypothetical protein